MNSKPANKPAARRFRVVRGTLPGFRVGKTWCADSARDAVRIDTAALAEPGALGAFADVEPAPVVAVYELREVPAADWR